jgi:hypothetical protein
VVLFPISKNVDISAHPLSSISADCDITKTPASPRGSYSCISTRSVTSILSFAVRTILGTPFHGIPFKTRIFSRELRNDTKSRALGSKTIGIRFMLVTPIVSWRFLVAIPFLFVSLLGITFFRSWRVVHRFCAFAAPRGKVNPWTFAVPSGSISLSVRADPMTCFWVCSVVSTHDIFKVRLGIFSSAVVWIQWSSILSSSLTITCLRIVWDAPIVIVRHAGHYTITD